MTDLNLSPDLDDYQAKDPNQALDAALALVRAHCGWHIAPSVSETVNVWSPDGCAVFLQTLNLTAITTIVQDSVTLASSSYIFETYGTVRTVPGSYFSKLTRLAVTFVHGYTELPDDVKNVVLGLAQRSISDTRGLVPGMGGQQVVVQSAGPQLTDADKAKLAPYAISGSFA
jgi:hypothetical protein